MASDNVQALRKDLKEYCERVPPAINNGSYDLAVKFKADVKKCLKVLGKARPTESELRSSINLLHSYW